MVVVEDSLVSMANKVIGAEFEPAILQILSAWFDCTIRSLSRSPLNQSGGEPHLNPSILRLREISPFIMPVCPHDVRFMGALL